MCEHNTEEDSEHPCTDEALDGLLWRERNQLRSAKGDSTDVSPNVVRDDQRSRHEEPKHAFENVIHHKMGLPDNEQQAHVCPGKLRELESVLPFLQRDDEEHKA